MLDIDKFGVYHFKYLLFVAYKHPDNSIGYMVYGYNGGYCEYCRNCGYMSPDEYMEFMGVESEKVEIA